MCTNVPWYALPNWGHFIKVGDEPMFCTRSAGRQQHDLANLPVPRPGNTGRALVRS
jgi:hypothetical protein